MNQYKNKGLTLIEALIWFAVLSAIIFGIVVVYQNTQAKANITMETKNIQFIFAGLQDAKRDGLSNDLDNKMASNLGIISRNLRKTSTGQFTNAWESAVA